MPRECQLFREVLQLHARHRGAQPALLGLGGPFTYQQLLDEVEQRQAWLSAQPPGTFALALENGPEALFWDLAALFAARPIVILPAFFSSAQRRHCLAQSGRCWRWPTRPSLTTCTPAASLPVSASGTGSRQRPHPCHRVPRRLPTPPAVPVHPRAYA